MTSVCALDGRRRNRQDPPRRPGGRRGGRALPGRHFWVPLAPLRDPGLVLATVAEVMEFSEQVGKSPFESLAAALAGKPMLLVLDNAEHLLPGLAGDLAALGARRLPTLDSDRRRAENGCGSSRADLPSADPRR